MISPTLPDALLLKSGFLTFAIHHPLYRHIPNARYRLRHPATEQQAHTLSISKTPRRSHAHHKPPWGVPPAFNSLNRAGSFIADCEHPQRSAGDNLQAHPQHLNALHETLKTHGGSPPRSTHSTRRVVSTPSPFHQETKPAAPGKRILTATFAPLPDGRSALTEPLRGASTAARCLSTRSRGTTTQPRLRRGFFNCSVRAPSKPSAPNSFAHTPAGGVVSWLS